MRLLRFALVMALAATFGTKGRAETPTLGDMIAAGDQLHLAPLGDLSDIEQTNWTLETLSGCNVDSKPVSGCKECKVRQGRDASWLGLDDLRVGGWMQIGYHSAGVGANSRAGRFNDYPDHLQLHQAWLYAEKLADGRNGFSTGGRIDYLYGTDGPNTQAFGTDNFGDDNTWDNDWDHGGFYGHAIPQLYGEVAYGDVAVKFGHFYTIIGYEVVSAPDNFFYSHGWQMNNIEPFTHTGALATVTLSDTMTAYAGYSMGWDSGFADNGDSFLGGLAWNVTDRCSLTYTTSIGRFDEDVDRQNNGVRGPVQFNERGQMHSLTTRYRLNDRFAFISQKDWIATELQDGTTWRQSSGFTNYFLYDLNRDYSAGLRFEYWRVEGAKFVDSGDPQNVYMLTLGLNCRPTTDLIIRPEVRWDWSHQDNGMARLNLNEEGESSQATFGIDAILKF